LSKGFVQTSTSDKIINGSKLRFGSWTEYGIIANKTITGAGSGSAFAGTGMANATICRASSLSFTNAGNSTCTPSTIIGNYNMDAHIMPNVEASFPISSSTPILQSSSSLNTLWDNKYTTNGNFTIKESNIRKGQWIVINASTADITINGNIIYTADTFYSVNEIPQVVIIAKNIYIADNVTNIDAWLIAKSGMINTCYSNNGVIIPVGAKLTTLMCNEPLVVNGPVMTNKLYLRRTAGSDVGTASGNPAEIFNLRADAYLWSVGRATEDGRIQTVYSTELPPRL